MERGQYAQAREVRQDALEMLYTPGFQSCSESQIDFVVDSLQQSDGPVVDIASGQGYLVEQMLRRTQRPIVATDFSPRILRQLRAWFAFFELDARLSLLAFDARRTPFKDGAVQTLTTYVGLANIEQPGALLAELRRISGGVFLACSIFYPPDDQPNGEVIRQAGLEELLYRQALLEGFERAGWSARVTNACAATALPTPDSVLLEGARIDGLPVAETCLEWGTVVARNPTA